MRKNLAFIVLATAVATASGQTQKATLHVGDPAPPLVIAKWAKGEPVKSLGNGNVCVVEFWATWCVPCTESIPHLTELAKKYKGKATFIGVDSFEHDPNVATCYPKVEKFVADFGDKMDYTVAIDGVEGTMGKTWMEAAAQPTIPTAFVIDRIGKIAWIGYPTALDDVVGKVIDGTFDVKAEAERQQKAQEMFDARMKLFAPIMAAHTAKKYPEEVAAIDNAIAADPQLKPFLAAERFIAMVQYDASAAQKYAEDNSETILKVNDPAGLNEVAWTMVEDKSPIKHLDSGLAVRIAERAAKLSHNDPEIADTLALAYYRANRISDALDTQKAAVARASATKDFDAATLAEMKERLDMYQKAADSGG